MSGMLSHIRKAVRPRSWHGMQTRTIASGTTNGVPWFNSHCGSIFRHIPNTCWTLVPLGTSSAVPSPRRNVTANYLRMHSDGYLFDAGESTFNQMRACYLCSLKSLRKVFITHMHGDHVFGLPSILMYSLELARTYSSGGRDMGDLPRLQVFGPLGLYNYLRTAFFPAGRKGWESMPVDIHELVPARRVADVQRPQAHNHFFVYPQVDGTYDLVDADDHTVKAAPLQHSIACYGFVVHEKEKRHMRPEILMQHGVPPGRIYAEIQKGKSVVAPDGTLLTWEKVSFPSGPGRKVAVLGDNADASSMVPLAMDADIISHECTIVDDDEAKAVARGHSTARMAGRFAEACKAKTLLLTHFSSSYGCSAREASIHWLGRNEVNQVYRGARSLQTQVAPERDILNTEADVLQQAHQLRTGKMKGPKPRRMSRQFATFSAVLQSLPMLQADDAVVHSILREEDSLEDAFDYMPDGYSLHQALLDGIYEIDRVIVDRTGNTHSIAASVDKNLLELHDRSATASSRWHGRLVHLPTCAFPPVQDVDSMQHLVKKAAAVAANTKVIAARDFMSLPLEGPAKHADGNY